MSDLITLHRGYRYRLYPTDEQAGFFERIAGTCRFVWNLALEQRNVWGGKQRITWVSQINELTELRTLEAWLSEAPRVCLEHSLRNLHDAFQRFFQRRSGYPKFKRRGDDSFRFKGHEIRIIETDSRYSLVKLPKVGLVKIRLHRPLEGEIRNATVTRTALGWEISITTMREARRPAPNNAASGIDRGVAVAMMLSDGTEYHLPPQLVNAERKARKAQQVAARKRRGSNRRKKAMRTAARAKARTARIRNHWQHETTTDIARRFGFVAMEDLRTRNMTRSAKGTIDAPGTNVAQKRGLNRSILNVGWHGLQTKLAYKLEERGGQLCLVPPKNTSRTCAECGTVNAKSRESQARFHCRHCGHSDNADRNAALNILALSRGGVELAA